MRRSAPRCWARFNRPFARRCGFGGAGAVLALAAVALLTAGSGFSILRAAQRVSAGRYPAGGADVMVAVVDLGQAESLYLKTPDGRQVLIDGGSPSVRLDDGTLVTSTDVLPFLRKEQVRALDAIFVTHAHPDHLNGLLPVLQHLPVRAVYVAGYDPGNEEYRAFLAAAAARRVRVQTVRAGDRVHLGTAVVAEVLSPARAFYFSDANNNSLMLRLAYRDFRFLAAGDAEAEALDWAADNQRALLAADVLKVPHHGSYDAVNGNFLQAVAPACAIISCGAANPFGHPHRKTSAFYANQHIEVFQTAVHGTVRVVSNGTVYAVFPELQDGAAEQKQPAAGSAQGIKKPLTLPGE